LVSSVYDQGVGGSSRPSIRRSMAALNSKKLPKASPTDRPSSAIRARCKRSSDIDQYTPYPPLSSQFTIAGQIQEMHVSTSMKQRIIIKLGTSVLTNGTPRLNRQRMLEIVQQVALLHQQGHEPVLVSSGAQAAGRERLNFPNLEKSVPAKQMLSAVGQGRLMHVYSELFDIFEIIVGQVLLTRGDLDHRLRYLNARDTLLTLVDRRIIPIVNENDATATEEIRVGDNDNLSALVANLVEADLLVILTDQPGLFTDDPRR